MKKFDPKSASIDELIARIVELGIKQYEMEEAGYGGRRNRAVRERFALEDELRNRDGDGRRFLKQFYEHPNIQVQCNAATSTFRLFPEEARRKLEQISKWQYGVTSLSAGMTLFLIDTGRSTLK